MTSEEWLKQGSKKHIADCGCWFYGDAIAAFLVAHNESRHLSASHYCDSHRANGKCPCDTCQRRLT